MTRIPLALSALLGAGVLLSGCWDDDDDDDDNGVNPSDTVRVLDTTYNPSIVPENFVDTITNPYWPMTAGKVFIYGENEGDSGEVDTSDLSSFTGNIMVVMDTTTEILGVTCTVVRDREYDSGQLVEDTFDWYAQAQDGTVWYFGEDTKELENGQVTTSEGSWKAGVDGAKPGIIMQNNPQPGPRYRQEYYFDHAEDWGQVVEVLDSLETDLDTFEDVVKIKETNDLEPDVLDYKYYAPGVGLVREEEVTPAPADTIDLTQFTEP